MTLTVYTAYEVEPVSSRALLSCPSSGAFGSPSLAIYKTFGGKSVGFSEICKDLVLKNRLPSG